MNPDRAQQMTNVVAHGLSRQVKLVRDLRSRAATFEQGQYFGLPRRQLELRVRHRLLADVRDLTKDAHDMFAADERYRADLDGQPVAAAVEQHDLRVGDRLVPDNLAGEDSLRTTCFLRRDDGRELAAADVSDEAFTGRIHPADHARCVDHVARYVDPFERLLDAHRLQHRERHATSVEAAAGAVKLRTLPRLEGWADSGPLGILTTVADRIRIACVQLTSGRDKAANLDRAEQLVAEAASTGADVVALPEKWNVIGPPDVLHETAESIDDGESVGAMRNWARTHGVTLVGGSITERREGREKLSNTCLVFGSEGELVATYRKIHLFDVEVGGLTYRESEAEEHGEEPVVAEVEGWPVGLTICYDLRFPELYRVLALEGALLATVPAHFTLYTGKDHWHLLLRARAVENGFYVAAPAQVGETGIGRPSYGRSLIVDPWGTVVAQAPDEETVISAELDRAWLEEVRRRLPSLSQRRPEAYRWPAPA
jgi:predicted amidohydrolase